MLGLVGLGKMGMAMAGRLSDQSVPVIGWDIDAARLRRFAELGHVPAASAAEVAEKTDTVVSIISDDDAVRHLFAGPRGFLEAEVQGHLFVEMSTISRSSGERLAGLVVERGAAFVDAPVMGSIARAREGSLLALVGGTSQDVARARKVLKPVTRRVEHLGPTGTGYAAKLCANLFMGCYLQAVSEATALAEGAGIDAESMLRLLSESPVASPWLAGKTQILLGGEGQMSLDLRSLRKDLRAAVETGAELNLPLPATAATLAVVSQSVEAGAGDLDLAAHAAWYRRACTAAGRQKGAPGTCA